MTDSTEVRTAPGRLLLPLACAAILLDALDLSITQVALPSIEDALDVPATLTPWVVNAYVLCYGGLLLLGGRLTDRFGARALFLAGVLIFGLGTLVAGAAASPGLVVAGRAIQGMGAAATVPAAVAALAATHPQGPERTRALGVFAAVAAAGFSLGLVLGGVLTETLGWRWVFFVKLPVVLAVALLAPRALPVAKTSRPPALRTGSATLATVALLLLAYCVTTLGSEGVRRDVAVSGVAAAIAAVVFVVMERGSSAPFVSTALLRNRTARAAQLASLTVLATPFGFAFVVTQYLSGAGDYSPLTTGLALLPGAVVSAAVSRFLAPRLLRRLPLRSAGALALGIVAAGLCLLLLAGPTPHYLGVVLPSSVVVLGLGMGLAYPVFNVAALTDVAEPDHGAAAGVQNTALQIGGGLGLAVVGGVLAAALRAGDWAHAVHLAALAAAAIPLLGSALFLLLAPRPSPGSAST